MKLTVDNRKYSLSKLIFVSLFFISFSSSPYAQVKKENLALKSVTWLLLQAIPSPVLFEDRATSSSGTEFGLEWQVTPYSYSFNTNRYLSHHSFFFIRPVKRFTGSAELFFTPQYVTGTWDNAPLKKFMYNFGGRVVLPVAQRGEYFCFSIGAGYHRQTETNGTIHDGIMYEAALYSVFGMAGLKFVYKPNGISRYNLGLYIKYY